MAAKSEFSLISKLKSAGASEAEASKILKILEPTADANLPYRSPPCFDDAVEVKGMFTPIGVETVLTHSLPSLKLQSGLMAGAYGMKNKIFKCVSVVQQR